MIIDRIKTDLTTAMKAGEGLRVLVLRMVLSEANYRQIDVQRELTDEDIHGVLAREVKKRREAIASFKAGNRQEQADIETKELEILQEYMPAQMTPEEIRSKILEMEEIKGVKDFGRMMKVVAPIFKGKADGAVVAGVVKELL
ncbi:MAG: hypothetical protein UX91_C0003G0007 [Candidatus Amesbacteria bacterium GW2011_GWB1_47_19]|nr:MAG: hypothetical protein UW51_C0003G0013 [Candidatus Amesbacteria bacterium GW2011_GWA1_44_24]KKU31438.1 MAG: hypothetical protein UX46_C0005G0007 [Candidatus Amesbacteria bacterium GW2011_GWC1_46_24]KKU67446.1 MAG: hypothetical protein UX91_C0003G0007 [Candidatus Amesbacteria bacterium GW2011_GWB1_47_19]HBC72452.1 glutamyl-tRNA amidotransferase [Candidatus Amesbacteria bacterium]